MRKALAMDTSAPLPAYAFRDDAPSLGDMLRHGVSDVAQVIPAAILHEPAIQLPGSIASPSRQVR